VDDPVFRGFCLRRSRGVREKLAHHVHQECEDAHADRGGRTRRRAPGAAIL
jgi:hypothetical protein